MLTDSHCHLDRIDLAPFDNQFEKAIKAANERGVSQFLCVAINADNQQEVIKIAESHPNIHASVGVHPLYTEGETASVESLASASQHEKVVAIGETGLDYFYAEGSKQQQISLFKTHVQAAVDVNLPLIIHTRDARQDTLDILKEGNADKVGGVLHCFTESLAMAESAMEMGFYISFSGIVTFNNADKLRDTAKKIPLNRILVETDSPYLTPKPYRGKPNSPMYVADVAKLVAEIRGEDYETFCRATSENYERLFLSKAR
ncbi:MAG: TatD family hydrolase [Kangiellaceae bacterium]